MSAFNEQPAGFRLPTSFGLDADTEQQARDEAWRIVVRGVSDADEFVDWATDAKLFDEAAAARVFEAVVAARREQQASWGTTPRTALTAAFEELDDLGIVARQNFSCCGSCASGEIWDERPESRVSRGYVYFHSQDTESLIESNETYVGYGVFPDSFITEREWTALDEKAREALYEKKVTGLMNEVVFPVLRRHGIEVEWSGDLGKRILLRNVEFYAPV